jgi:hypothetical protein
MATPPDHKWIPAPAGKFVDGEWLGYGGCRGCALRPLEFNCNTVDCRPRNGVPVIAVFTKPTKGAKS